jgi:hypothetical protein
VRWVLNFAVFKDFMGEGKRGRRQFVRGSDEEATTLHFQSTGDEGEAGRDGTRHSGEVTLGGASDRRRKKKGERAELGRRGRVGW